MDPATYDIVIEGLRVLFIGGVPIVLAAAVAGLFISLLQGATTIVDPAIGYAARLVAVLGAGYLLVASIIPVVISLFERALGPS